MRFSFILTAVFLAVVLVSCSSEQGDKQVPQVRNGQLDLRNWDFEKDGPVDLGGDWEFQYGKFILSSGFDSLPKHIYYKVPNTWGNYYWHGKKLPYYGYASYRLRILLNKDQKELAFRVLEQPATAFKLFVNDELNSSGGRIGTSKETSSPHYHKPLLDIKPNKDTVDLVFWVSNFHYWKGGLFYIGKLGTPSEMKYQSEFWLIHNSFILGAYLIFFLNFLFIYIFRSKELTYLYFSIWCLDLVIRIASTGELVIMKVFPGLPWELLVKFEIGSMYLLGIFGALYWNVFMFNRMGKIITNIFLIFGIISTITVIVTPAVFYSQFLNIGKAYIIIIMLYYFVSEVLLVARKKEGHVYIFIGMIVFFVCSVNEILWTTTHPVLNIEIFNNANGFFIFFTTLAIYMSGQYSRAFTKVEKLSTELTLHKEELEKKVIERTKELREEKNKSDKLLLNVLPEPIANRLKDGETSIADHFEEASIIFIDIADFTKMSVHSNPQKMVNMLNDIFTVFDKMAEKYGLEKIKTIGDCYMAAAGIPEPREDHAKAIAMMALESMREMDGYKDEAGNEIRFRIGLDCGPIVAGVIGEQKFIYDLWGDPVNTASRMEYFGVIGKIQCTDRFVQKLKSGSNGQGIIFEERGEVEIKGKGVMRTWFLEKDKLMTGEKIEIV